MEDTETNLEKQPKVYWVIVMVLQLTKANILFKYYNTESFILLTIIN